MRGLGVGEVEVMGKVTGGDIEVWLGLKLPIGIDALQEKLGFRVDPKTGRLKRSSYTSFR